MPAKRKPAKKDSTANFGFEAKLWLTADKLRNNMDAAEYKHVVLGLIFLKYISDSFEEHRAKLIQGEYFLTRFASAEGKNGGQFYTPSCVVRCLVEMLEPYKGRIYDPCCGSGGMFVQSERFVESELRWNYGDTLPFASLLAR